MNQDIKQKIEESAARNPNHTPAQIAKNMHRWGVTAAMAREVMTGIGASPGQSTKPVATSKRKVGRTFGDFAKEHDIAGKIKEAITEHLPRNGELYYTDDEFREMCGVHVNRWRRYADMEQFAPFQIKIAGRTHWAPTAMIEKMRYLMA